MVQWPSSGNSGSSWFGGGRGTTGVLSELENQGRTVTEPSAFESCFPDMSFKSRVIAFGICAFVGFCLSIVGVIVLFFGQVVLFALLYVIGLLASIAGTGFLIGPKRQLQLMTSKTRIATTIALCASIVMVFVSAFVIGINVLVVVFAVTTYLAYIWYSLSYIPYARSTVEGLWTRL